MNPKISMITAGCLLLIAGVFVFLTQKGNDDTPPPEDHPTTLQTQVSNRERGSSPGDDFKPESREELAARQELAAGERDKMTAMWLANATGGFGQTRKHLVTDLRLSAAQAEDLGKVFAARENELANLLAKMTSGETESDEELFGEICALIRNKGLRDDLTGVLSPTQLEAFDQREAKRERETIEARAYRDLAEVNAVVPLTDSQKQEVLGVLGEQAPERVEQEADARAFMSLTYGGLAAEMDSSHVRGLANILESGMVSSPDFEVGTPEYEQWTLAQRAERIENEIALLQDILDKNQLTRYREHLEAQIPR